MTQGWDCSWDIEVWGKVHRGVFFYLKHSVTRHAYSVSQILCAALCSCSCCKQSTDCLWPHTVVSRMCVWGIASEDRDDVSLQTGQWSLLSKIRSQFLFRVTTVSAGATDLPWHWPVKMGLCGSHLTGQIPPAPASTEGGELSFVSQVPCSYTASVKLCRETCQCARKEKQGIRGLAMFVCLLLRQSLAMCAALGALEVFM